MNIPIPRGWPRFARGGPRTARGGPRTARSGPRTARSGPRIARSGPRTARNLPPLVGMVAVLLAVGACGASSAGNGVATLNDPSASPASPSPSLSPDEAMLAFTRCMREHGIDMPDPQVSGDGKGPVSINVQGGGSAENKKKFTDADAACRHFMQEAGGGFADGKGMDPADQDALIAYSRCMREHGIDMPDPQFQDGGGVIIGGDDSKSKIDPNSSAFKDAHSACSSLLPGSAENGINGPAGPAVKPGTNSGTEPGSNGGPASGTKP
jgi:hypothetical protein